MHIPIRSVDDVNDAVTLGIVLVPQALELLLAAKVPKVDTHAGVVNLANVEPDRRRYLARRQRLVAPVELGLELLEERRLARVVQPEYDDEELVLLHEPLVEAVEQGEHRFQVLFMVSNADPLEEKTVTSP